MPSERTTSDRTHGKKGGSVERLEDRVVVIHDNGYELFDTDDLEAEEVTRFTDSLPGENPNAAAFNADAHPDHSSVELVDSMYDGLEVTATLQRMRNEVLSS